MFQRLNILGQKNKQTSDQDKSQEQVQIEANFKNAHLDNMNRTKALERVNSQLKKTKDCVKIIKEGKHNDVIKYSYMESKEDIDEHI